MAHVSPATARELDHLIAEITTDSNGDDEALSSFEVAFENDVRFPLSGTVVGEDVQVLSVGVADGRRELIATVRGPRFGTASPCSTSTSPEMPTPCGWSMRTAAGSAHDGAQDNGLGDRVRCRAGRRALAPP